MISWIIFGVFTLWPWISTCKYHCLNLFKRRRNLSHNENDIIWRNQLSVQNQIHRYEYAIIKYKLGQWWSKRRLLLFHLVATVWTVPLWTISTWNRKSFGLDGYVIWTLSQTDSKYLKGTSKGRCFSTSWPTLLHQHWTQLSVT